MRDGECRGSVRTTTAAFALLLLGAVLTPVELRRQGITEKLAFIPDERPIEAPPPPPPAVASSEPLARSLEIVLLDGLRLDAAEESEAWRALAPRGARLRGRVRFPVYSGPGRSLLVTGAPPEVTGITGNDRTAGGRIDSIFARAAARGIGVRSAGWDRWLGLAPFPEEKPGEKTARSLSVLDWFECDKEGHDHGAATDEYRRAVSAVSSRLIGRVAGTDLERDAILAVADHGHMDGGGHLGVEPDVATVPVLLLGRGVRAGFRQDDPRPLEDVGATASVLLGLPPPALGQGVPIADALDLPEERRAPLEAAYRERREELARAWEDAVSPGRVILVRIVGAAALLTIFLVWLRPSFDRALAAALAGPLVTSILYAAVLPPMSTNGGPRELAPLYAAVFLAGIAIGAGTARALAVERESAARAVLVAWLIVPVVLLGRLGLGPGGLAPHPAAFPLALSCGYLAFAAACVLAAELVALIVKWR